MSNAFQLNDTNPRNLNNDHANIHNISHPTDNIRQPYTVPNMRLPVPPPTYINSETANRPTSIYRNNVQISSRPQRVQPSSNRPLSSLSSDLQSQYQSRPLRADFPDLRNINTEWNQIPNQNSSRYTVNSVNQNDPNRARRNFSGLGKMDQIFADAFKSLKRQHIFGTIIVFIFLLAVLLLYNFKVFKGVAGQEYGYIREDGQSKFSILPFITSFQVLIIIGKIAIYFGAYNRVQFALLTAQKTGNSSNQEQANISGSFDENISEKYLHMQTWSLITQGMDDELRKMLSSSTSNKISRAVKDENCCTHQIMELCEFGMFISSIFIIVTLAQGRTTWLQKLILITIVVYWMLQNIKMILYTCALLLCPLITVIVLIYACCSSGKKKLTIPESVHPTQQQILNSGGSCSVCMMDFERSDNVVMLPCSDKHMFHELCINGWLRVKTTCPICRFDMADER